MTDDAKRIKSRRNLKKLGVELSRTMIELPRKMWEAIDVISERRQISKRVLIEGLIRRAAMDEQEFRQVMLELSMSLPKLVEYCRRERLRELGVL